MYPDYWPDKKSQFGAWAGKREPFGPWKGKRRRSDEVVSPPNLPLFNGYYETEKLRYKIHIYVEIKLYCVDI